MIGYSLLSLSPLLYHTFWGKTNLPALVKNKNETWISLSPSNLTELYLHHDSGPRKAALSSCL